MSYFVAGTDTGVGKTLVSVALLKARARRGQRVVGMKPIAAGAEVTAHGLRNEDALVLGAASNVAAEYETTNPYCLPAPLSPHIAAREAGVTIDIPRIVRCFDALAAISDCVVVEGSGGWLAPIDDTATMADVARALHLPVILVVGLRLGCLSHTLLTASAIETSGLHLAAWVGSQIDPRFSHLPENVATLERRLGRPPLAVVPYGDLQPSLSF